MLRYVSIGIISIRIISIIVEGVVELSIFIASANWYFYLYEDNILQLLQQPQLILHLYVQKKTLLLFSFKENCCGSKLNMVTGTEAKQKKPSQAIAKIQTKVICAYLTSCL